MNVVLNILAFLLWPLTFISLAVILWWAHTGYLHFFSAAIAGIFAIGVAKWADGPSEKPHEN